ncbi:hypothetical protein FB451DRAFT_1561323 [Mycena latifolia]|nr:hypothetical protein FB451DRAFT_1561323 [Mycena latifolia]
MAQTRDIGATSARQVWKRAVLHLIDGMHTVHERPTLERLTPPRKHTHSPTSDDAHRFILASRSPYFHTALVSWPRPPLPSLSLFLFLAQRPSRWCSPPRPSRPPPSSSPSAYTGTLVFSHRTYDLSTALALLLSARVVSEMTHGLFRAATPAQAARGCFEGLAKRTTPENALAILWAGEGACAARAAAGGGDGACEWDAVVRADSVGFEDGERVEWAMRAVVRGVDETNVGRVYPVRGVSLSFLSFVWDWVLKGWQAGVRKRTTPTPPGALGGADVPAPPLLSQMSHVGWTAFVDPTDDPA